MMSQKKRIMLVDNEKEFLNQLSEMLQLSGYETHCYSTGKRALKDLKQIRPNVILLDLNMDGIDGFEMAQRIKGNPQTDHIPIIVVSGMLDEQKIQQLKRDSGVKRCLVKPVKPVKIISEIEKAVS